MKMRKMGMMTASSSVKIQKLNNGGVNVVEGGWPHKSLSIVPLLESLSLTLPLSPRPPHYILAFVIHFTAHLFLNFAF